MLEKKEHIYENAVLVGLITKDQDEEKLTEYMDELEFLAYTAGATVKKRFTQKLSQPDSRTFVGKGKAEEIKLFLEENIKKIVVAKQAKFTTILSLKLDR